MDELENVEISEQQNRQDAYKAAKKGPGKYEDKFNNDITGTGTILSKYDDAVKEEGITLDESGGVNEESRRKLEEVRFGYYFSVAYSEYFITCNRMLAPTTSF
jgi:U4/U6.U5 tri-snRNP-associated protein 1